jgi:hypothetical protein
MAILNLAILTIIDEKLAHSKGCLKFEIHRWNKGISRTIVSNRIGNLNNVKN